MKKNYKMLLLLVMPLLALAQNNLGVSTSQYTTSQLVNTVLLNNSCGQATNISSSAGNGLGYFQKNSGDFAFENGIILSTGNAVNAANNSSGASSDNGGVADADIDALFSQTVPFNSKNATVLEFDFIPQKDHISLEYLFASNEYGTYQCSFGDAMAFLLTDAATGNTINMALVPNTNQAVSVVTIRSNANNSACTSSNAAYFGNYYGDDLLKPVNFKGITVPMTAQSSVVPFTTYHLKIVIADRMDPMFDSAIFIKGGSFDMDNLNNVELLSDNGAVLCGNQPTTLSVNVNEGYSFEWKYNGLAIAGETTNSLTAQNAGEYTVTVSKIGASCTKDLTIVLTQGSGIPETLTIEDYTIIALDNDGTEAFDLSLITDAINGQLTEPANFEISYFETLADAEIYFNNISNPIYNNTTNPQTLYVRIQNQENGCFSILTFSLIVIEPVPSPSGNSEQTFTEGQTLADIEIEGENILWYDNPGEAGGFTITPKNNEIPLPLSTLLVGGTTYYASQTINGIESSDRLAVTVAMVMGLEEQAFTGFEYYPNPVNDVLTVTNNNDITNISVINMLGQTVITKDINSTKTQLDMSSLNNGVYLIKIVSEGKNKTLKIIKE
jgi:hypothetical protein